MITLDIDGAVGWLRLARPQARNALAMADWEAIPGHLEQAATSVRVLIVTGEAGAFCAGADLAEFPELQTSEEARRRFRKGLRSALDAFATLPIPSIAWVEGVCYGAGVALAMACDIRIASSDARFAITPAKIGIGYPQEDVHRLVSLVGPGAAARLLFTGASIEAAEALRIGLVEAVGESELLLATVGDVLACDRDSIAMLKRGVSLAFAGVRQDDEQDRRFEALLHCDTAIELLSRVRASRRLPPRDA